MRKHEFVLASLPLLLASCSPSSYRYANNLTQGASEGYVFYRGFNRYLSDGSDFQHFLESITYEGYTYDLSDSRTTNTFFSVSDGKVLVVSGVSSISRSLIYEYAYRDGSVTVLASVGTSSLRVDLLSGRAISICGSQTSYIYNDGMLYDLPGEALWFGDGFALTRVYMPSSGVSGGSFALILYCLVEGTLVEEATIPNPLGNAALIALVSDTLGNECTIRAKGSSTRYYTLDASDYKSGFIESRAKNYIQTYTDELNIYPYGLKDATYEPSCIYETSAFTIQDDGVSIQWQNGSEDFIQLPRHDGTIPEVSFLKQARLVQIKYNSKDVFTYNLETKEVVASGCMFDIVPMSSQYTLWEDDSYRFIVQNDAYERLGPGNAQTTFLLRKNKKTGAFEKMQRTSLGCKKYCYLYSFNYVDTSGGLN